MMDEIRGSITKTLPPQSRFSRAANGKPGTFCADSETLNKFVTVHKVTKHWIQTEFEQRGVETLEKKQIYLIFLCKLK